MKNLLVIPTAILIFASCKQKAGNEKPPYVTPLVDSSYAKQKVEEFKKGQILFNDKCSACHVSPEGTKLGLNMFENLFEKLPRPSEEYFAKYICDGAALRKSGDKYSNKLYEIFNHSFDHVFNKLSQDDLDQLIVYIKVADKAREHGRRLTKNK